MFGLKRLPEFVDVDAEQVRVWAQRRRAGFVGRIGVPHERPRRTGRVSQATRWASSSPRPAIVAALAADRDLYRSHVPESISRRSSAGTPVPTASPSGRTPARRTLLGQPVLPDSLAKNVLRHQERRAKLLARISLGSLAWALS